MPKISIITIVYNGESSIGITMDSVAQQTYSDYEHIVIDGNSTDNTLKVVNSSNNPLLRVFSEQDAGIYDAMNKGIELARGTYLVFMNAGDSFAGKDALRQVSTYLDGIHHFYGDSIRVYGNQRLLYKEKANSFSITRHNICHQAIFYLRNQSIRYNLRYKIFADWELNIREFKSCGFKHIPIPVCEFSMDGISSNSDRYKDRNFMDDLPELVKKYIGFWQFVYVKLRFELRKYV